MTLKGKTAVVTGSTSGIGLGIAHALAKDGANIVMNGLGTEKDNEKAITELKKHGTRVAFDPANMLRHNQIAEMIAKAQRDLGSVDILVNNAGIQHVAPVEEFDPATFAHIHQVMLHAPFLLARALLPGMYDAGWGRLVHVSSVHGHRASPYKSAYVSAKHGLEGLSKVIALEAAAKGVTSNTICPGYVRTPLVEGQISDQARSHGIDEGEVLDEVLLARTPVKRLVEPDEVAGLVAFLCGPGTDSINGTSYLMDGGWTAA